MSLPLWYNSIVVFFLFYIVIYSPWVCLNLAVVCDVYVYMCVYTFWTIVKTRRSRTFENHPGTNAPVGRPEVFLFFFHRILFRDGKEGVDSIEQQLNDPTTHPTIRSSLRKCRRNHFPKRDNISIIIISSSLSSSCFCFKGHDRVTRQVIDFWPSNVPENCPFVFIPSIVTIPTPLLWHTTACAQHNYGRMKIGMM